MKTGFILHLDSLSVLDELTNEQAGILFKAIRDYNSGKEPELGFAMRMAFIPFKNQFERDNKKYNKVVERNRNNGAKGGRPKKPKETEETQSVILKPKKADNNNDNNNDNKNNNIYIPEYSEFLAYAVSQVPNVIQQEVKLKYDSWVVNGWKDGNDKKIVNWKSKLNNTLPFLKKNEIQHPRIVID